MTYSVQYYYTDCQNLVRGFGSGGGGAGGVCVVGAPQLSLTGC